MNKKFKCPPQTGAPASTKKVYVEFDPDPAMLRKIKALAQESGCTPFEMCVKLVRGQLAIQRSRALN